MWNQALKKGPLACAALALLLAFAARAQQQHVDLVGAKQEQDARLQALQAQLDAAKTKPDAGEAVTELTNETEAVRGEDLWSKTGGPPALTLQPGGEFHPFNFAVLSDLHLAEHNGPQRLTKALDLISRRRDIAFVLVLGDIIWDKDPEQLKPVLAKAGVPVHLVYGNNDWKWVSDGSYEKAFGPRDFVFRYNNCTFIGMYDCLPKGQFPEDHKGDFQPAQWTWLEDQLKTAQDHKASRVFVAMHVPPRAPGEFNSFFDMYTNTEQRFFDLLEKYNVSAGLFGHLHQAVSWKHNDIQCYVTPSCCWNFISRSQKVDSSFVRIVKVEEDKISDALLPVRLEGETFTWETLPRFYDAENHPK